jgi:hypothetical protein
MKTKVAFVVLSLCLGVISTFGIVDCLAAPILRPGNPVLHPDHNQQNVPVTSTVSITYDEAINPSTVNTQTFAIYSMDSGLALGNYTVNGGMIQFSPSQPFHGGEMIEVVATTGTLGISGQGPLIPTVWQFRTITEQASAFFRDTGQELGVNNSWDVALGDLDGDGDLDAFVAKVGVNYVWFNDGSGHFTNSGHYYGSPVATHKDVKLGDLNGDGDLDAFVVVNGTTTYGQVWFNDGTGHFTDSPQNLGGSDGASVSLGDLDGDGDLDALFIRSTTNPSLVLLNDGTGHFTDSGQTLNGLSSTDAALGDLDGDGDLDAFVTNNNNQIDCYQQVWINDGTGHFTDSPQQIGNMPSNGVSLGDVNGDGSLDAVLAITRPSGYFTAPNEVWFNNGSGVFSDSGQRLGVASTNQAVLGDLDGDGDLDVFFTNLNKIENEVWLNDGSGFYMITRQFLGVSLSPHVALGDLNNDNILDAFMTHIDEPDGVWINLRTHIWMWLPIVNR